MSHKGLRGVWCKIWRKKITNIVKKREGMQITILKVDGLDPFHKIKDKVEEFGELVNVKHVDYRTVPKKEKYETIAIVYYEVVE